jgi:hypothetical protein
MATAALIDDTIHIDHINPYTATNTFGVPTNGGFYDGPDGTYIVERDETPQELNDPNEDLTHFTPDHINRSGPLMVNEAAPSPAPFLGFPARKFEYPDTVTTTWYRPGLNKVKETPPSPPDKYKKIKQWVGHINKDQDIMILLLLAALIIYMVR